VFTVGHSNRSLAEFVALLEAHDIDLLVDVRSYPGSRRHPQFDRLQLERELPAVGLRYLWLGGELGGMRDRERPDSPHTALDAGGFRNYADHMETPLFAEGIARLLDEASRGSVACMCAEKDWVHCHRAYLSDALEFLHATRALHIADKSAPQPHQKNELARVVDGVLRYDAGGQQQATLF